MFSKISFYVEGLNFHTCINSLCKQGINLSVTDKTARSCVITVAVKDSKKVLAYLHQRCYNITRIKPKGIYSGLYAFKKYTLLAVSCLMLLVLTAFCSNYCLRITVDESCIDRKSEIVSALGDYGIKFGTKLSGVSLDKLENYLCNTLDLAHVVADISGSTLHVEIYPRTDVPTPIDYNSPFDIVAAFDGKITRMVIIAGTPLVSVGDVVTKGQILIAGYVTFPDQTTQPIRAVGEVYAIQSSQYTEVFSPQVIEYEKTGEYVTVNEYYFGNILVKHGKNPYSFYQTESQCYSLFPLNIVVTTTKIYCLKTVTNTYTFEERKEALCKSAREKAIENADFYPEKVEYIMGNDYVTAIVWTENSIVYNEGE